MHDMLVRLYDLPSLEAALATATRQGIVIRRAIAPDAPAIVAWMREHFANCAAEAQAALAHVPTRIFVALRDGKMLGFACHDVTCLDFFGPEGVAAGERGKGIGRALLLAALHAQRAQGYAYSIIGGVGPASFYERTVGAVAIAGSTPGVYADRL